MPVLIIIKTFATSMSCRRSLKYQLPVSRGIGILSPDLHPPVFLAPLIASAPQSLQLRSSFSTTASLSVRTRKKRDGNPHRGESALRRTGINYPTGMSMQPLPQPVLDPNRRSKIEVDPNHGLWGFFNKKKEALTLPDKDSEFGMSAAATTIPHTQAPSNGD